MNRLKLLFVLFLLLITGKPNFSFCQNNKVESNNAEQFYHQRGNMISALDTLIHLSTPILTLPEIYKNGTKTIPWFVDNSTQPYLRWIYYQSALECGQSAGIAYNFTYEIDRVRNVAATDINTQYPTHFAWNFKNKGSNIGVNCLETWDVLRTAGTPNVEDWGGTPYFGGFKLWKSGYDFYYNSMKNRIYQVYAIPVNTPEGLLTLKAWIYDHMDGSDVGSLANFYSTYISNSYTFPTLPAGTPEAGKKVITTFGSYVNHCQTIVGFNDSIRFDYNQDGQYTNNVDINGDAIVDMRDWEIGGLKFTNSFGYDFADNGFCYMMYKTLADNLTNGGIWNNTVYVIKVRENVNPLLTYKVKIKHTARGRLKVSAGISSNLSASTPDYIQEFSVFNNQGGDFYMTGDSLEEAKTLEFGLDVSQLLNNIQSGSPTKFFLKVDETDPSNQFSGEVINFSVINYTSGTPSEIQCTQTNVPIQNNTTTYLTTDATISYSTPQITDNILPTAEAYENYQHQLTATQGTPPYKWEFDYDYQATTSTEAYPNIVQQQLTMNNNDNGYVIKNLPFTFTYYGKKYNQLVIYVDGYVEFRYNIYSWPFPIDNDLIFKSHELIAPYYTDLIINSGQGVWFESNTDYVAVRWLIGVKNQASSSVNISLKLYANGQIEFYYGNITTSAGNNWKSGISRGNVKDILFTSLSNSFLTNTEPKKVLFTVNTFPDEINLSEEGILTGTISTYYNNFPIKVKAIDNNDLISKKTVSLSSSFSNRIVVTSHSVVSGNDDRIENGEEAKLTVTIKNIDTIAVTNAQIVASSSDPFISFTDNTEYFGYIGPGNSYTLNNAFKFNVSSNIPNEHPIFIDLDVICDGNPSHTRITLIAYSAELVISSVEVFDGNNNTLNKLETDTIKVTVNNSGGSTLHNINAILSSNDNGFIISKNIDSTNSIAPFQSHQFTFIVRTYSSFVENRIYDFILNLTSSENFHFTNVFSLYAGSEGENFETGNYSLYPWQMNTYPWTIKTDTVYEGNNSSRSGIITHNQNSDMSVELNVLTPGFVRFHKKVSCEDQQSGANWDYLQFSIDGTEQGRWDGTIDWSEEYYPVTAGNHTFKWSYIKDYSVSAGFDAAWVDNIKFPVLGSSNPQYATAPDSIQLTLNRNELVDYPIYIQNTSNFILLYQIQLKDLQGYNISWLNARYSAGSLNGTETDTVIFSFDTHNLQQGIYQGNAIITFNNASVQSIPIQLTVVSAESIDKNENNNGLSVFPNPSNGNFTMQFDQSMENDVIVRIFSMDGKCIQTYSKIDFKENGRKLNIYGLTNAGVYIYSISSKQTNKTGKISVVRGL